MNIQRPNPFTNSIGELIGCVWFNKVPTGKKGWDAVASVGGGIPFSVVSMESLSLDVIWMSNLNKQSMWSIGQWKRLKGDDFMGASWTLLCEDAEGGDKIYTAEKRVMLWSEVITRMLNEQHRLLPNVYPLDMGDGTYPEFMAEKIRVPDKNVVVYDQQILKGSLLEKAKMEYHPDELKGRRVLTILVPFSHHILPIMKKKLPVGVWTSMVLPSSEYEQQMLWDNKKYPYLVKLDHVRFKEDYESNILGSLLLGGRGRKINGVLTDAIWLTIDEWLRLREYVTGVIVELYKAEGWGDNCGASIYNRLEGGSSLLDWSITHNSLIRLLWKSVSSPLRGAKSRSLTPVNGEMVWMHALDRIALFEKASVLQNMGYQVLSYGDGVITIAFDPSGDYKTLVQSLPPMGLLVPASVSSLFNDDSLKKLVLPEDGVLVQHAESIVLVDVWFKRCHSEVFQGIDRILFPWAGTTVKESMKLAAQDLLKGFNTPSVVFTQWLSKNLKAAIRLSVDHIKSQKEK